MYLFSECNEQSRKYIYNIKKSWSQSRVALWTFIIWKCLIIYDLVISPSHQIGVKFGRWISNSAADRLLQKMMQPPLLRYRNGVPFVRICWFANCKILKQFREMKFTLCRFDIMMWSSQFRNSHSRDETVIRSSYLYINSYTVRPHQWFSTRLW